MLTQLNPTIPIYIVSKDKNGYAHAIIDYSQEHDLCWLVSVDDTGEFWCVPNKDIRAQQNYSINRNISKEKI
jgi:hypothetical protein